MGGVDLAESDGVTYSGGDIEIVNITGEIEIKVNTAVNLVTDISNDKAPVQIEFDVAALKEDVLKRTIHILHKQGMVDNASLVITYNGKDTAIKPIDTNGYYNTIVIDVDNLEDANGVSLTISFDQQYEGVISREDIIVTFENPLLNNG
jgi:hypothetical protein